MHRWIPQVPPYHLGYVPTPNPYVTFSSRGLERSQDPKLPEESLRKNRNNRARDSKLYMYNHVLPHVQPRTTHPPSCIRGGSRAPSPPENKKIIKLAVFKLNSSKPTYKLMYHPTSITQKIPPTRHPGADLGGGPSPVQKISIRAICNKVPDSKHYMHQHVQSCTTTVLPYEIPHHTFQNKSPPISPTNTITGGFLLLYIQLGIPMVYPIRESYPVVLFHGTWSGVLNIYR